MQRTRPSDKLRQRICKSCGGLSVQMTSVWIVNETSTFLVSRWLLIAILYGALNLVPWSECHNEVSLQERWLRVQVTRGNRLLRTHCINYLCANSIISCFTVSWMSSTSAPVWHWVCESVRDDYRELIELSIIFLGGLPACGIHFMCHESHPLQHLSDTESDQYKTTAAEIFQKAEPFGADEGDRLAENAATARSSII